VDANGDDKPTIIPRLFSNPRIAFAGSLAGILGIPLAIYFYVEGISRPDIVYYTNPVRTIVVQQGTASKLAVSYEGHPLTQDVTAVQIAIWNRGRQAVRKEAVLQPLVIKTNPKVPILEATVKQRTRDVVGLTVDESRIAQGEASVSWKILEQSDGGVIQLVYAGSPDVKIECDVAVEGQRAIHELTYGERIKSPAEQLQEQNGSRTFKLVMTLLTVFVLIIGFWLFRHQDRKPELQSLKSDPLFWVILFFGPVGMVVILVYVFLMRPALSPPFGFQ
jgi:hypothetical protein